MASNRLSRINDEIQRELASLLRTVKDPRLQGFISVTGVETTGDLRYAKVYISVLDASTQKDVFRGLKSASGYLRREIAARLQLRYTPELVFAQDHAMEHGARITALLNTLDIPEDEDEAENPQ